MEYYNVCKKAIIIISRSSQVVMIKWIKIE